MTDKPKKSIFKRWWFWAIIVILFIFIAAGSGGNNEQPQKVATLSSTQSNSVQQTGEQTSNDKTADTKQEEETPQYFKVGEIAELNGVKAIITSIEKPAGDEFNKPDEGKEFVLVNMTIENDSKNDISVSSILSFNAYVDDSAINEDLMAQSAKKGTTTMDGTISPGKKLSGCLGYQLPKGWKVLEIEFKPNAISDSKIVWKIDNK
ncbi:MULTISPECIES: DUF4352 domain-containing protein [Tepidanaerobacter]|uniref:DUF4352 domain-containing protein n=1 Tax=Tepidanaerobacter TaxID=499228 RepID=UPI000B1CD59E|nr:MULTISPECIES: DUF4352 domain-containing protein [Tepidanaerobacter]